MIAARTIGVVKVDDGISQIPARHAAFRRKVAADAVMTDRETRHLLDHPGAAELFYACMRTEISDKRHSVAIAFTGFNSVGNVPHRPQRLFIGISERWQPTSMTCSAAPRCEKAIASF